MAAGERSSHSWDLLSMGLQLMTELVTLREGQPCLWSQSSHPHYCFGLTHLTLPTSLDLLHPTLFLAFPLKSTGGPATTSSHSAQERATVCRGQCDTTPHFYSVLRHIYAYI